jgi:hypothetical protein
MPPAVGAGRHLGRQQVLGVDLPAVRQLGQFRRRQHRLELGRRLAGLGAVGLVGDHREALALGGGQLLGDLHQRREGLDGADHDLLAAVQGLGQFPALAGAFALDHRHHPRVRSKDSMASCSCLSSTVRSETTITVSNSLRWLVVVQVGQEVGGPGDGVGLARAGGVLDQVAPPGPSFSTWATSLRVASSWW